MQCFGHHYGENDYSVIFLFFIDCYIIDYLEFFSDKFSACPAYSFSVHVLSEFTLFQCKHNIKFHRVWHLSPASFIYKAVIWNTMLMVCSPMLSVSTEPCGVANLSLQQCLEFDTQQNREFLASGELITISVAPQIALSPLNHYIRLNVLCNDQKDN